MLRWDRRVHLGTWNKSSSNKNTHQNHRTLLREWSVLFVQQVARYLETIACILMHEMKPHWIWTHTPKIRAKTTALFKRMICLVCPTSCMWCRFCILKCASSGLVFWRINEGYVIGAMLKVRWIFPMFLPRIRWLPTWRISTLLRVISVPSRYLPLVRRRKRPCECH